MIKQCIITLIALTMPTLAAASQLYQEAGCKSPETLSRSNQHIGFVCCRSDAWVTPSNSKGKLWVRYVNEKVPCRVFGGLRVPDGCTKETPVYRLNSSVQQACLEKTNSKEVIWGISNLTNR